MKTPGIIYLQTCGDCIPDVWEGGCDCDKCNIDDLDGITWSKDRINDSDAVYFSEEAVRKMLSKVVEDANSLIGCARRSAVFTSKLDASKYIPHIIDLLKGGEK